MDFEKKLVRLEEIFGKIEKGGLNFRSNFGRNLSRIDVRYATIH